MLYIEDNAYGRKYGDKGLELDHVRPLASFKDGITCKIQQYKAFCYLNLQLLTREENRAKWDKWTNEDAVDYAESDRGVAINDGLCDHFLRSNQ